MSAVTMAGSVWTGWATHSPATARPAGRETGTRTCVKRGLEKTNQKKCVQLRKGYMGHLKGENLSFLRKSHNNGPEAKNKKNLQGGGGINTTPF